MDNTTSRNGGNGNPTPGAPTVTFAAVWLKKNYPLMTNDRALFFAELVGFNKDAD